MQVRTTRFLRFCASLILMGSLALALTLVTGIAAFACTPGTATGSCTDSTTLSATGTGTYSDTTPTGTLTPPAVDGAAHTGAVSISLTVSDFRGVAGTGSPNWSVGLTSAGVSVPTVTGVVTKPISLGTPTGACSTTGGCSGEAVVDKTSGSATLNGTTSTSAIASAAAGDFGIWNLTIPGTFSTDANTVGGTFTGSVTVTLTTPVTTP